MLTHKKYKPCSSNKIRMCTHARKCSWYMFQGHVAATPPLVCADYFWHAQDDLWSCFVPATCCTEFNSLGFMQHVATCREFLQYLALQYVAGPNVAGIRNARAKNYQHARGDVSLRHVPGACPRYSLYLCVYKFWFCCCYMSPLHVPAMCPLIVNNTWFFHCYISLRCVPPSWIVPTCAKTFMLL